MSRLINSEVIDDTVYESNIQDRHEGISNNSLLKLNENRIYSLDNDSIDGVHKHNAFVHLILDIGLSMKDFYNTGEVYNFFKHLNSVFFWLNNKDILDVWVFDKYFKQIKGYTQNEDTKLYVDKNILTEYKGYRTEYSPFFYKLLNDITMQEDNVSNLVIVITDNCTKGNQVILEDLFRRSQFTKVFWKYIVRGISDISYIEDMQENFLYKGNNYNFMSVRNLGEISIESFMDYILYEYSDWLKTIK